jgi:crossover junction endodeoxyribonuclease RuvC
MAGSARAKSVAKDGVQELLLAESVLMAGSRRDSWRSYRPGMVLARAPAPVASRVAVRVLGLDPGSRLTGFGVVDVDARGTRYVASGAIRASGDGFAARLQDIYRGVAALVAEHHPDEIAIERVFVHKNPDSALKLGQARGAALCAAFGASASFHEYTPRAVKLAVVGAGGAQKEQVNRMVKMLLGLDGRLQADAADALAVALCHCHGRCLRSLAGRA